MPKTKIEDFLAVNNQTQPPFELGSDKPDRGRCNKMVLYDFLAHQKDSPTLYST